MNTAYYTFTTWHDGAMAAGFDSVPDEARRAVMQPQPRQKAQALDGDNVIDLTAWRAANLEEFQTGSQEEPDELDWESAGPDWVDEELPPSAPRPRKSHRAMLTAELISTLSVVAVAVVIIVRVLTF